MQISSVSVPEKAHMCPVFFARKEGENHSLNGASYDKEGVHKDHHDTAP